MFHQRLASAALAATLAAPVLAPAGPPPTLVCPAEPALGTEDRHLRPVWEAPAATDDYLFGRLIDARFDGQGNLCLLDRGLTQARAVAFPAAGNDG